MFTIRYISPYSNSIVGGAKKRAKMGRKAQDIDGVLTKVLLKSI